MRIYTERHLSDFQPWAGARETMAELTDEQVDDLNDIIEEVYPDGIEETELNDLLWFDNDTVAEWLGFANWEALQTANKEEENE